MFSKITVVCLAALAVLAQAGHEKRHTHSHKNGTFTHQPFPSGSAGYPAEAGVSSGLAPYPTSTGGLPNLSTGVSPPLLTTGAPVPTYTTTVIVTKLTTYCPGPTTLTQNGKTYTVTTETTLTISECPCTSTYTTTGFPTPTESGDTTLTYVIGTGSSTSTVVTTIHHKSIRTNYHTVYTTAGNPIQSTIYDSAVPSAGSGLPGLGEGGATGSVCAAPVTVTITGPEQTVTVTATSPLGSGASTPSAVVGPPVSSALVSSSAPYGLNNGTQPTGTAASTGFLTKPSASFTLKPSPIIVPSSGAAAISSTPPSSSIAPSPSVASTSGIAASSGIAPSSNVASAVVATAVMQAYN